MPKLLALVENQEVILGKRPYADCRWSSVTSRQEAVNSLLPRTSGWRSFLRKPHPDAQEHKVYLIFRWTRTMEVCLCLYHKPGDKKQSVIVHCWGSTRNMDTDHPPSPSTPHENKRGGIAESLERNQNTEKSSSLLDPALEHKVSRALAQRMMDHTLPRR